MGMFFNARTQRGRFRQIINNWPSHNVQIIVVTDGGRILGLGDLGDPALPARRLCAEHHCALRCGEGGVCVLPGTAVAVLQGARLPMGCLSQSAILTKGLIQANNLSIMT